MATGDQADMLSRMRSILPTGWFGDEGTTPVLDSVLSSLAAAWAWCYSLIQFVIEQARLSTSSGVFVDLWASSWFGTFGRLAGENDAAYIARIKANLFLIRATRPAFITSMTAATGDAPTQIIEFMNPSDTGGWGTKSSAVIGGGGGYDQGGIYFGSLLCPGQFLLTQSLGSSGDTQAQFYPVIEAALPAGVTAWTDLTN